MKRIFIALVLGFGLSACSSVPSAPQIVNVPIATKCSPTVQVTPITDHPIGKIVRESTLYEKVQLLISELDVVTGQNIELTAALSECTK